MAPFGRNFLKARMKNRSKESLAETPAKEIQVLVCKEEKIVSGVTKHTTCADVIQALLEDHKTVPESKRLLHGEPKEFCLLERWKGFERPLPPLTRILRLWNAWGDEKPFINFVLVKTSEFLPSSIAPMGAKRGPKSRSVRSKRLEQAPGQYAKNVPVERQKRLVKKAFRKLEKMQKTSSSEGMEEIDKMVQLVISQDYTIRQQIHQIRKLEQDIDSAEQKIEESSSPDDGLIDRFTSNLLPLSIFQSEDQLQEYLYTSDGIEQLELQMSKHRELINKLSRDIDLELRRTVCTTDSEELEGAAAPNPILDFDPNSTLSPEESLELDSIHSELELSMRAGLSLHTQNQDLERDLQLNETLLQSRNQEYQLLIEQLSSMQLEHCSEPPSPVTTKSPIRPGVSQQTIGKVRKNIFPTDVTDTDSDTGISSTHSQDSLSPCVDRLRSLDTDV
ncbi:ras association domain-containing protein 9 [Trichomycterus rosablanca]|uniref:ras association domain-containing protein 9 n=1 Tax=Trichomycterus rosablanca TaxID=2290929 RepID=UPI002F35D0AA